MSDNTGAKAGFGRKFQISKEEKSAVPKTRRVLGYTGFGVRRDVTFMSLVREMSRALDAGGSVRRLAQHDHEDNFHSIDFQELMTLGKKELEEEAAKSPNGKVLLVGHSMGGALMAHLAAACPEKVEGVILVNPLLRLTPLLRFGVFSAWTLRWSCSLLPIVLWFLFFSFSWGIFLPGVLGVLLWIWSPLYYTHIPIWTGSKGHRRDRSFGTLTVFPAVVAVGAAEQAAREALEILAQHYPQIPVKIIQGMDDRIVAPEGALEAASILWAHPKADVHLLGGTGHSLSNMERRSEFTASLYPWIEHNLGWVVVEDTSDSAV